MVGTQIAAGAVVVAEGELFKPQGAGWAVTHMDDSYAAHSYGGMWLSQGGCLGASAASRHKCCTWPCCTDSTRRT